MSFSPRQLLPVLCAQSARRYVVAYSGGVDSHVLLHALAALRPALAPGVVHALHVDHGLRPQSREWARHCAAVCAALDVPCQVQRVQVAVAPGMSPEDAARRARHAAFVQLMQPGDCLLTAHHQDDQAETVLLQLLRGSGPQGLAGMPASMPFGPGVLLRPLLAWGRVELQDYAAQHRLHWIEDDSNAETGFDRNYLRHEILPRLMERWPSAAHTLARAAGHCAAAAALNRTLAGQDLARLRGDQPDTLSVYRLRELAPARQDNALRVWLAQLGLATPSTVQLARVRHELLPAAPDAMPCVHWPGAELRRYRDLLYAMTPLPGHDAARVLDWDLAAPLTLPDGGGCLRVRVGADGGLDGGVRAHRVTVRFRRGGEWCLPAGRGHRHALKKLFQEAGVPPWRRDRVPLLYVDDALAAVVGLCVCEPFAARAGEPGLLIEPHVGRAATLPTRDL